MNKSVTVEEILASRPESERKAIQARAEELKALRMQVNNGLDDIEAGRTHDFSAERIVKKAKSD